MIKIATIKTLVIFMIFTLEAGSVYAASGGHHESSITDIAWYFVNFFLFFGLLTFFLKGKFVSFWHGRADQIAASVNKGERALELATKELQAAQQQLATLPNEIKLLQEKSKESITSERHQLETLAQEERDRLERQASSTIKAERESMERELRGKLADQVLEEARKRVRELTNKTSDQARRSQAALASATCFSKSNS